MKILLVINSLYTGGAEFSTLSFYGWMVARGHQVKLVLLKRASPSFRPDDFGISDYVFLDDISFIHRVRQVSDTISKFQPKLVHSVLFEANMVVRASRIVSQRFFHLESLVNEVYSNLRLSDPKVSKFKLRILCIVDRITQRFGTDYFHANGIAVAEHYIRKVGVNPRKIKVIPRGRKPNLFIHDERSKAAYRNLLGLGANIVMVNVARHEFQKGQDTLLEAVAKLEPDSNFTLLLVGREGNFTETIENLIRTHSLKDRVRILGHRDDVTQILSVADIFVFPSRFEGLPGVLIEAEAAALPIVCSNISNNLEVVDSGSNALVFPVNDIDKLSKTLNELINDSGKREAMSRESHRIYCERFDIDAVHERMLGMIERIVSKL